MTTMFKRRLRGAPFRFAHFLVFKLTLVEWLALIFIVLAMTVER